MMTRTEAERQARVLGHRLGPWYGDDRNASCSCIEDGCGVWLDDNAGRCKVVYASRPFMAARACRKRARRPIVA